MGFWSRFYDPIGIGYGDALFGGKKKGSASANAFTYQPYSGFRPPAIDTEDRKFLRPTQALTTDIISNRAQGIGVGYDPARRQALEALLRSQLGKREEDEVRAAQGMASAAGLSGNLAAQEAMQGRVRRDIGRTLGEGLTQITIEDLERANQERDINTARLQALNLSNFGQENQRANFDLGVYNAEQGNRLSASQQALNQMNYENQLSNQGFSDLLNTGIAGASLFMGQPQISLAMAPNALQALSGKTSGTGIDPKLMSYYAPGFNSLMKYGRNIYR